MYIKTEICSYFHKIAGYLACVVEVISCEVQRDHWCCFHFLFWWKWFDRFDDIYQFPFWFINLDLWCLVSRWGLGILICRTIIKMSFFLYLSDISDVNLAGLLSSLRLKLSGLPVISNVMLTERRCSHLSLSKRHTIYNSRTGKIRQVPYLQHM